MKGDDGCSAAEAQTACHEDHGMFSESSEQRRRRLQSLPTRAEDAIMQMRYSKLEAEVSRCKLENEVYKWLEREEKKKRRRDEELGTTAKRWRSSEGVWFTTLAEVALKERPEMAEDRWLSGSVVPDSVDSAVDGLLQDCLREPVDRGEPDVRRKDRTFEWLKNG